MLRAVLTEAGGTLVSVVTSSKFRLRWGVLVSGSVVSFCFLSWDLAISFGRTLGCERDLLSDCDVCGPGVDCTTSSRVGSGCVVSGTRSVQLLRPSSSTMWTDDLWSMR